jgi:hypothetical protein
VQSPCQQIYLSIHFNLAGSFLARPSLQLVPALQVCTHQISIVLRRPVLDRTFRFYAPHTDVLRETIWLDSLPGRHHTFYAPGQNLQQLSAISSHAHVVLTTRNAAGAAGSRDCISLKTKSQACTPQSETFYITFYADVLKVCPLETWQVCCYNC